MHKNTLKYACTWIKLINEKKLSLSRGVELLSVNAAKLLKLNVGSLKKGKPADLVVFDPNKKINCELLINFFVWLLIM